MVVNKAEVLTTVGELGITIVLDNEAAPHPKEVAVRITVPEKPGSHVTRPVTLSRFPAVSLFHDQVTKSLELN